MLASISKTLIKKNTKRCYWCIFVCNF